MMRRTALLLSYLFLLLLLPSLTWGQALSRREASLINPLEYGVTCTTATLAAAISAAGSTPHVLMLTPVTRAGVACVWAITSNLTVPSTIVLHVPHGASVAISGGVTLTLARYPWEDNRAWKTGAGTLVITEADPSTGVFNVRDFGAVGNGVADDRNAIQLALNTAATGSKTVYFPSGTYYLGSFSVYTRILDLSGMGDNVTIQTEKNVTLTTNTTADVIPAIFYVQNNSHLRIGPLRMEDLGYDANIFWHGAYGIQIINTGTSSEQDLVFDALYGRHLVSVVSVSSGPTPHATNRTRGITIGELVADDCIYGFTAANDGDGVTINNLLADFTWRSYFVYGVARHSVNILSRNPRAGSGNVLISRGLSGGNTTGIDVNYVSKNANNPTGWTHVLVSHQDILGGEISGIRLNIDIRDTGANSYHPLRFVNYDAGTTESGAASPNLVKDIYISGTATAQALPITVTAAYATKGIVHFQAGYFFIYEQSFLNTFWLTQQVRGATAITWASSGTQPSLNNGTLTYSLDITEGLAFLSIKLVIGSTSTMGTGDWIFGAISVYGYPLTSTSTAIGSVLAVAGGTVYTGVARMVGGSATIQCYGNGAFTGFSATVPTTWATGDELYITITFPLS